MFVDLTAIKMPVGTHGRLIGTLSSQQTGLESSQAEAQGEMWALAATWWTNVGIHIVRISVASVANVSQCYASYLEV